MEGSVPIEQNLEALKRILASLFAMAGMAGGASALPRRLHRAILRLLRPAESAARRLIIAAARGIVVSLPPARPRKAKPKPRPTSIFVRNGVGTGIVLRPGAPVPSHLAHLVHRKPSPRPLSLSLIDPLKRYFRVRRRYVPAHAAPRIRWLGGFDSPFLPRPPPPPAPPTPDDPIDAARLSQRLSALAAALDDLPGQAKRFARWQARHDAALARDSEARDAAIAEGKHGPSVVPFRRSSPLRRGRPPGGRLSRYDPDARRRSNIREIDEILAHAHAMAVYALDRPDTS